MSLIIRAIFTVLVLACVRPVAAADPVKTQEELLLRRIEGLDDPERLRAFVSTIRASHGVPPRHADALVHLAVTRAAALLLARRLTNPTDSTALSDTNDPCQRQLQALLTLRLPPGTKANLLAALDESVPSGSLPWLGPATKAPSILRSRDERPTGLVLFGIDGLRKDILDSMLASGRLPRIRKHLLDRGLTVDRLVCCYPTVTPPSVATMLTGVWPDRHRIPALAWYDPNIRSARLYTSIRERAINRDLGPGVKTLWEFLRPTMRVATVGMPLERGCHDRWFHLFYPDRMITGLGLRYLKGPNERPTALGLWYLDFDTASHLGGTFSVRAERALETFDRQVGRVVDRLIADGTYSKTLLVLVSDHGSQPTIHNVDIMGQLSRLGLTVRTLDLSVDPFFPWAMRSRFAGVPVVGINVGAGTASLYLQGVNRLRDPTPLLSRYPGSRGAVDLLKALLANEAVDVCLHRAGPLRFRVVGRQGSGQIEMSREPVRGGASPSGPTERRFRYRPLSGRDPLGVPTELYGSWLLADEWNRRTARLSRPGAVPAIAMFLATGRAGDLAVSARPGYNFSRHFHCKGGYHGALSSGEMITRLVIAGPGVPRARLAVASMADVTPTILSLLKIPYTPRELDGRSIVTGSGSDFCSSDSE